MRFVLLLVSTSFLISGMACPQAAESNTSYIDEHNRFILNGEPFFPIGLYVCQCSIVDQSVQLDEIANSPFDTLMNYTVNTCSGTPATPDQITAYLDQLDSRNLKLIYALNEYIPYDPKSQDPCGDIDISSIQDKVGNPDIRNHDAVISWYLNDEVGSYDAAAQADCLAQLEAGYEKIKELDGNHAVWSVHWSTDWLLPEAHTTDILGMDSYPIAHLPITEVSRVADAAAQVGAQTHKPFWLVPQIFNWRDYPDDVAGRDLTGRPPTKEEMRAMTYLAVNHGAKGLIYYSYFNIIDDDVQYGTDVASRWEEIKGIAGEIDQLRHIFLSTYQTGSNQVTCNSSDIDFKLMWEGVGGIYYLFAVNTKEGSTAGVSFQINLANPGVFNTRFEGGRTVDVTVSGTATDDFDVYEVHVYHWLGAFEEDADFTADHTSGVAPLAVQFSDRSTWTTDTTWAWNFGDGGTSTEQNPSYTYNDAGDFNVSLTVTGLGGTDTQTKTDYIHVEPAPVTDTGGGGGGGGGGGSSGGGCFVATAAFGSYVGPHVQVMKDFRDEYLLTNMPGRWFVDMYNTYGPYWADLLNAYPSCKPLVRIALMPVVGISYFVLNTSLATKLLTGFLLVGFIVICFKNDSIVKSFYSLRDHTIKNSTP